MKSYQSALYEHLATYKRVQLGIDEHGTFNGRAYPHILPKQQQFLNFLDPHRDALQSHCQLHHPITLHKDFHHLNSSQAFALNMFFPYFAAGGGQARALSAALGVDSDVVDWQFEHVPNAAEGTNVDVMWRTGEGSVFCEVKLSEAKFGTARADERHRDKLAKIYRPRLEGMVAPPLLDEAAFFANYQILRNISLLAENSRHQLVFFMPRKNAALERQLPAVLRHVAASVAGRIKVAYVEDCLDSLARNNSLSPDLRRYALQIAEKYIPEFRGAP